MSEQSFKEAYGVLQRHSEALRNQREPNIDDLLKIVTESVDAYKVCTARIDAVEQALEHALGGAGAGTGEPITEANRASSGAPRAAGSDNNDEQEDDVPF